VPDSYSSHKINVSDYMYPSCADGISKPIAGLPPCHAEISNKFSGENKNSSKHQHATSQNTFLDVLLPAHQTSPVHLSGE